MSLNKVFSVWNNSQCFYFERNQWLPWASSAVISWWQCKQKAAVDVWHRQLFRHQSARCRWKTIMWKVCVTVCSGWCVGVCVCAAGQQQETAQGGLRHHMQLHRGPGEGWGFHFRTGRQTAVSVTDISVCLSFAEGECRYKNVA